MDIKMIICIVIFLLMIAGFIQSRVSRAVVALTAMAALVMAGCLDPKTALSGFANSNTILMASMFVVSEGFSRTQAVSTVSKLVGKISKGSFTKILFGYVMITMLLSQITGSSSAAFAIVFPIAFSMCDELGFCRSKMLFSLGLVSIVTCGTIPIGGSASMYAQYNGYLEAFGIADYRVGFFDPFIARLPSLIVICLYSAFIAPKFSPELSPVDAGQSSGKKGKEHKPLSPIQEKLGYGTFIFVVAGMLLADVVNTPAWLFTLIGALIIAASEVLSTREVYNAASMGGIVMMYVGVLGVGTALTETGAGDVIGNAVAMLIGNTNNGYVIGALFFVAPYLLTQVMNNRAVVNIFIPITIMTCSAIGCNPVGPLMLSFAGSLSAFMTPMATATVNMFMGLGGYSQKELIKMSILPSTLLIIVNVAWIMTVFPAF